MMQASASIFFDFRLPNATTWFYFSLLLAVAVFFKFRRLLSFRNWDVISLFLLVPGFLLLEESRNLRKETALLSGEAKPKREAVAANPDWATREQWFGYLWLLCGSGLFFIRCLVDLALIRRPSLAPNLSLGGLAWLGVALFICLIGVALRPPEEAGPMVGKVAEGMVQLESGVKRAAGYLSGFDAPFWVDSILAVFCHLAVVSGLVVICWVHFQDVHAGMAAALFYLLLPYTALHVGQVHHVWPIALLTWAVVFYRRPALAGLFFGLAAGSVYFPALVFPMWLGFYWRRGAGRFAAFFVLTAGISLIVVGVVLLVQGELGASLRSALNLSDWQAWKKPTTEGFWLDIHWAYRIPVFMAYLIFVAVTAIWPSPKNLAQVLSLSAAVLIGIQFWYADQGGVFVLWYLPLLLLLVFRPNLSDRRPPVIAPETDWLGKLGRWMARRVVRLFQSPEPAASVH
jgi:hypothetical protein